MFLLLPLTPFLVSMNMLLASIYSVFFLLSPTSTMQLTTTVLLVIVLRRSVTA